jgi:hypothetical protein
MEGIDIEVKSDRSHDPFMSVASHQTEFRLGVWISGQGRTNGERAQTTQRYTPVPHVVERKDRWNGPCAADCQ